MSGVVIRGVNWVGDAVMTLPAIQQLRTAHPSTHISMVTPAKLADLWSLCPDVNTQIHLQRSLFATAREIRKGKPDAALVFPNSSRSALEIFLAGVRQRIGFSHPVRNWLLTQRVSPPPRMHKRTAAEVRMLAAQNPDGKRTRLPRQSHHVYGYLRIAAVLGADAAPVPPRLVVPEAEVTAFREKIGLTSGKPVVGINPGAEYGPAKRWPIENFVAAAAQLRKNLDYSCLIFGTNPTLGEELRTLGKGDVFSLVGKTTLRQLIVGLKLCDVVLTNDTGPMHLAAAVGTPVIVPFGSTAPELTGPRMYQRDHHVLTGHAPCAPCFRRECPIDLRCLRNVSVEEVVGALRQAIAK